MATGGVLGNGTKVAYSAASPVSWTRVAQLQDIPKFLELIADDVDTTVHSTSRVRTSMGGMIPPPEIELDLLLDLDPSTTPSHDALLTLQGNGLTYWWRIEVPTDRLQTSTKFKSWEFQAYVKSFQISTKIDEPQKATAVLRYAGGLSNYAIGSSAIA